MKVNFKCFTRYYKTGKREKYDKKNLVYRSQIQQIRHFKAQKNVQHCSIIKTLA